ncbi:MAG: hypothetical protein DRQ62_00140, partial [Gammaproteobacteria bacterium]
MNMIPDKPYIYIPTTVPKIALINNGHWSFPSQMGDKKYVGFIYVIRDNYMGKFYLGKKQYRGAGK